MARLSKMLQQAKGPVCQSIELPPSKSKKPVSVFPPPDDEPLSDLAQNLPTRGVPAMTKDRLASEEVVLFEDGGYAYAYKGGVYGETPEMDKATFRRTRRLLDEYNAA